MAIKIDFSGCSDVAEKAGNSTRGVLIYASLAIGMKNITANNWMEWHNRIHIYERSLGAYRKDVSGVPNYFTAQEVKSFIGFETNSEQMSKSEFLKSIWEKSMFDRQQEIQ